MQKSPIRTLFLLLFSTALFSCEKEVCSCTTTVTDANGNMLSLEGSTEETPASGRCSDLYLYTMDPTTGVTTSRICQ